MEVEVFYLFNYLLIYLYWSSVQSETGFQLGPTYNLHKRGIKLIICRNKIKHITSHEAPRFSWIQLAGKACFYRAMPKCYPGRKCSS